MPVASLATLVGFGPGSTCNRIAGRRPNMAVDPANRLVFAVVVSSTLLYNIAVVGATAVSLSTPDTVVYSTHPVTGAELFFQQFPSLSCYWTNYEEGADWIETEAAATPEACAAECLSYSSCTGFELYTGSEPYCSLWFDGHCAHEEMQIGGTDIVTAVLMDGTARFMNQYCFWNDDFVEGVDYVIISDQMTWDDCVDSCEDTWDTPSAGTTSTTVQSGASINGTNATTITISTSTAASPAALNATTASTVTVSNVTGSNVADLGPCTGIESVYSTGSVTESCALYYGGSCLPSQLSAVSDLIFDTARFYSLGDQIEPEMATTLELSAPYSLETIHKVALTTHDAMHAGFGACNPGAEVLRGFSSCGEYVSAFPCDCETSLLSDVCVGNTTAAVDVLWVTSQQLVAGLSCSESIASVLSLQTYGSCRDACLANSDCNCFKFMHDSNGSDPTALGSCELLTGAVTATATDWPLDEDFFDEMEPYYTFKLNLTMSQQWTIAELCPTQCASANTDECVGTTTWNTLTIIFLCCLVFAFVALGCAVAKWIHNSILLRRQRMAAAQQRRDLAMSQESIQTIQTETFDADSWEEGHGDPQCIICLAEFENGDELRVLKCKHRFHVNCIDQWLKQQGLCPICKVDLRASRPSDPLNISGGGAASPPAGVGSSHSSENEDAQAGRGTPPGSQSPSQHRSRRQDRRDQVAAEHEAQIEMTTMTHAPTVVSVEDATESAGDTGNGASDADVDDENSSGSSSSEVTSARVAATPTQP